MFQPAHVDGRSLVILRMKPSVLATRFEIITGGRLSYDGERLVLRDSNDQELRTITEEQLSRMQLVTPDNRIPECAGYDLFMVQPEK